jgi:hypothetical protein
MAREGARGGAVARREILERRRIVRRLHQARADRRERRVLRHRQVVGQARQGGKLVEQQAHHASRRAALVVFERQLGRAQDQLAQQRRDREHFAVLRHASRCRRLDVERAHVDSLDVFTRCTVFGGIHTARCGGTIQVASCVSTVITPRTAKMSWKRGWLCHGISNAGGRSRAIAPTGRGTS